MGLGQKVPSSELPPLKPSALQEGSSQVRIATAGVADAVLGYKVDFCESPCQLSASHPKGTAPSSEYDFRCKDRKSALTMQRDALRPEALADILWAWPYRGPSPAVSHLWQHTKRRSCEGVQECAYVNRSSYVKQGLQPYLLKTHCCHTVKYAQEFHSTQINASNFSELYASFRTVIG